MSEEEADTKKEWDEVVYGLGLVSMQFQRLGSVIKMAIWELVAKSSNLGRPDPHYHSWRG
jgi:hypothetical protein